MERKDMAKQTVKNLLAAGVITPALAAHEYGILIQLCDLDLTMFLIDSHILANETEYNIEVGY